MFPSLAYNFANRMPLFTQINPKGIISKGWARPSLLTLRAQIVRRLRLCGDMKKAGSLLGLLREEAKDVYGAFGGAQGDIAAVEGESHAARQFAERPAVGFAAARQVPKDRDALIANRYKSLTFRREQHRADGPLVAAKHGCGFIRVAVQSENADRVILTTESQDWRQRSKRHGLDGPPIPVEHDLFLRPESASLPQAHRSVEARGA